jgi:hypothetical protein
MSFNRHGARLIRVSLISVCILTGVVLIVSHKMKTHAQTSTLPRVSMTSDWSNRHMLFSAPTSAEQAERLQKDPRYLQQVIRENLAPRGDQ